VTDRQLRREVESGRLVRLREGAFCAPSVHPDYVEAGRHRGRVACISALRRRGVFVLETPRLHLHVEPTASRLRPLAVGHRVHRRHLVCAPHPDALEVEPLDALRDAIVCQPPRAAVASIDSALHLGFIGSDDLPDLFRALPKSLAVLRPLIDPRAESGPETLVRLILRSLRCAAVPQVEIPGVGRVDFLVDGWLIIECDSEAHHGGWESQRADRRRDLAAASRGLTTLRPIAEDAMWHGDVVRSAIAGLLEARVLQKQDKSTRNG